GRAGCQSTIVSSLPTELAFRLAAETSKQAACVPQNSTQITHYASSFLHDRINCCEIRSQFPIRCLCVRTNLLRLARAGDYRCYRFVGEQPGECEFENRVVT